MFRAKKKVGKNLKKKKKLIIINKKKNRKESDIKTTSVIVPLIGDADSSFRKRGIQTEIQKQMKGYGETE